MNNDKDLKKSNSNSIINTPIKLPQTNIATKIEEYIDNLNNNNNNNAMKQNAQNNLNILNANEPIRIPNKNKKKISKFSIQVDEKMSPNKASDITKTPQVNDEFEDSKPKGRDSIEKLNDDYLQSIIDNDISTNEQLKMP